MLIGLMHLHKTLGYLVFVAALINLVLVLTKARSDARVAALMHQVHTWGLLMAGRLNLVLGIVLMFMLPQYGLTTWWAWISLLLWGPVEAVAKRMVKPEVAIARDGGTASGRMAMGAGIELLMIVAIFGLMSARPG